MEGREDHQCVSKNFMYLLQIVAMRWNFGQTK